VQYISKIFYRVIPELVHMVEYFMGSDRVLSLGELMKGRGSEEVF
jgi:hypothetical protein